MGRCWDAVATPVRRRCSLVFTPAPSRYLSPGRPRDLLTRASVDDRVDHPKTPPLRFPHSRSPRLGSARRYRIAALVSCTSPGVRRALPPVLPSASTPAAQMPLRPRGNQPRSLVPSTRFLPASTVFSALSLEDIAPRTGQGSPSFVDRALRHAHNLVVTRMLVPLQSTPPDALPSEDHTHSAGACASPHPPYLPAVFPNAQGAGPPLQGLAPQIEPVRRCRR